MYSISEVAKLADVTSRALRHYEEKGIIEPTHRGQNGYRHYSEDVLLKIIEIKKLRQMNFSLEEIKAFLILKEDGLSDLVAMSLKKKSSSLDFEIEKLLESKKEIDSQLFATNQFLNGKNLGKVQRRALMEAIKSEVLEKLKEKKTISQIDLNYLKREEYLFDSEEKREFISALKNCLDYAKREGILIGPARGSSPALLSLYALGWSQFDPSEHDLVPERFAGTGFDLHIDVEFKNGKKFIDYCRIESAKLSIGKIEAFRLPILDIIENVHARLGKPVEYEEISDNDPVVLDVFRRGDIEKIFSFDFPQDTLMAKYFDNNYYKNGKALKMLSDYLKSQEIVSFKDLLNIEAIFRPDNLDTKPFMREFIDRYPKAKKNTHTYKCLNSSINEYLSPNYGLIIYQEDIIHIIKEYTSWSFEKCNYMRRALSLGNISDADKKELEECTGTDVLNLLIKESPVVFCKAHSVGAWSRLVKKTAVLKTLHKKVYFEEIEKWESENDYSWGDFGFISGGVSLLQQ